MYERKLLYTLLLNINKELLLKPQIHVSIELVMTVGMIVYYVQWRRQDF